MSLILDGSPLAIPSDEPLHTDAEMAAFAFLARYSGRTLDAYRTDLRMWFQWCADRHLPVLEVRREHLEAWCRATWRPTA